MVHGQAPGSVLDGAIVFALLWSTWCSYVAEQHGTRRPRRDAAGAPRRDRSDVGGSLAIPEAFDDLPGGVSGPLVLVVCYAVVRFLHIGVYLVSAGSDQALRRQVLISLATSAVPAVALLALGVLQPEWQRPIWLAAVACDILVTFVTSRGGGGWVVRSAAHFSERHGLIVILALGESVVAVGVGAAEQPVGLPIILAAGMGIAVAIGVWLQYFLDLARQLEHPFGQLAGRERARAARDVFTYLHLPIVLAAPPLLPDAQPWLALAIVAVALIGTAVAIHKTTDAAPAVDRIGDGS